MPNEPRAVLTKTQQSFFDQLGFTKVQGLYLAGGTALALQINHRTSVDFDFYTSYHFKKGVLSRLFRAHLKEWKLKIVRDTDDTFELNASPDIHVSCFYYEYPLLKSPRTTHGALVSSLPDIAAMKIVAISQRGARRDFIDIHYLLQRYTLKEILRFTQEKYDTFDIYHGLRGLLYFEDADNDRAIQRAVVFDHTLTWNKVKHHIVQAVREFQESSSGP